MKGLVGLNLTSTAFRKSIGLCLPANLTGLEDLSGLE
jgi:hypothetical protein